MSYPKTQERIFDGIQAEKNGEWVYAYPEYAYGKELGKPIGRPIEFPCPCFLDINGHLGQFWRGEPCYRGWCDARGKEVA